MGLFRGENLRSSDQVSSTESLRSSTVLTFFYFFVLIAFSKFFSLQPFKNLALAIGRLFRLVVFTKLTITYCNNQIGKSCFLLFNFPYVDFLLLKLGRQKSWLVNCRMSRFCQGLSFFHIDLEKHLFVNFRKTDR